MMNKVRISWACSPKVVRINEIVRSVEISNYYVALPLQQYNFFLSLLEHLYLSWAGWCKMLWTLLGYMYNATKACSPRKSTWFTRLLLLVRRWGLGTRLLASWQLTDWEALIRVNYLPPLHVLLLPCLNTSQRRDKRHEVLTLPASTSVSSARTESFMLNVHRHCGSPTLL